MGRLYSQDSKPKVSYEANAILIFIEIISTGRYLDKLVSLKNLLKFEGNFIFSSNGYLSVKCK
jgi:hypothetical protein